MRSQQEIYVASFCEVYKASHPLECDECKYGSEAVETRSYYECIQELKEDLNTLDVKARWYLVIATLLYGLFFDALAKSGWPDKSSVAIIPPVLFFLFNLLAMYSCLRVNSVYFVETELMTPDRLKTAAENYYVARQKRKSFLFEATWFVMFAFMFFTGFALSVYGQKTFI